MELESLIGSDFFASQKHTDIEFKKIFSTQWIFAAMEDELSENNMFLTINIFDYPIVLQNFKGVVKAFENICSLSK